MFKVKPTPIEVQPAPSSTPLSTLLPAAAKPSGQPYNGPPPSKAPV